MLASLQGHGWCPMCGGGAWRWAMMIFVTLLWLVIIALGAWFVFRLARGDWRRTRERARRGEAEEILRQRYARGEIDRETYHRMLEDLRR
jgi:putative membrane protein